MKRCLVMLSIVLAVGASDAWTDIAVLRGVRYTAGDSLSRVTLTMDGTPRYTGALQGTTVRVGLSSTRIGPSPGESMFKFRDGLVRSISLVRCPGDSVEVLVVMREPARYRIARAPAGNGLQVIAFRPMRETATPATRRPLLPGAIHPPGFVAPVPLVDIPSIAREQLAESSAAPATGKAAVLPVMASSPSPLIGMLLIGITMLGGFAFLYLVLVPRRAAPRARATSPADVPATGASRRAAISAYESAGTHSPPKHLPEAARSRVADATPAEEDEESYQMARSFSRGREEVLLARRFQEAPTITQHRITKAVSDEAGTNQRATAARRLGVGRGEVDLAMRLKGLQNGRTTKEEVL